MAHILLWHPGNYRATKTVSLDGTATRVASRSFPKAWNELLYDLSSRHNPWSLLTEVLYSGVMLHDTSKDRELPKAPGDYSTPSFRLRLRASPAHLSHRKLELPVFFLKRSLLLLAAAVWGNVLQVHAWCSSCSQKKKRLEKSKGKIIIQRALHLTRRYTAQHL